MPRCRDLSHVSLIGTIVLSLALYPVYAQKQDSSVRLQHAAELIRQEKHSDAESELRAVLRVEPGEPNALNLLGVIRARQSRFDQAEQLFLQATRRAPSLIGAFINLGALYLERKKPERAIWAYGEAFKLAPDRSDVNFGLANSFEIQHRYDRALDHLNRLDGSPSTPELLDLTVRCYAGLGRTAELPALVARFATSNRLTSTQAAGLAGILTKHNLVDPAIEILEKARATDPGSFVVLFQLGASHAQKRDWSRAEESYAAALEASPSSVATLRELSRVARARGELEKALSQLVRARKLAPDSREILYDFAVVAFEMDLIVDALSVAERLHREDPDSPRYIHLLAVTRFRHDEKPGAEALLRRYIALRPRDPLGHYLLGVTLHSVSRYEEATRELERSAALGSGADAEYLLALIALDVRNDSESARRLLEQVLKAAPNHAAAHALLGVIFAKQNDNQRARATLERAVQLDSRNLRAHYQLGLVYARLGDKERAQQMFDRSDQLRGEQRREESVRLKLADPPQ